MVDNFCFSCHFVSRMRRTESICFRLFFKEHALIDLTARVSRSYFVEPFAVFEKRLYNEVKKFIHKLANDRDKRLKVISDSEPYLRNRDQFYLLNGLHPKP